MKKLSKLSKYTSLKSLFHTTSCLALSLSIISCETSNDSHIDAYIAEQQPENQKPKSEDKITDRIIFIGDAGSAHKGHAKKQMAAVAQMASKTELRESIVYLGDNIYQKGYQSDDLACSETNKFAKRLQAQIEVGNQSDSTSYFVPGNHDWDYREEPNPSLLLKQKKYVESCGKDAHFVPSKDEQLSLVSSLEQDRFSLIFLDTQAIISGPKQNKIRAITEVSSIIDSTDKNKTILIAGHHPISTHGPHGGCYQNDYIGSSIINLFRKAGYTWGQDINEDIYDAYIRDISAIIPKERDVVFVAGHDHSLQVLKADKTPNTGPDYSLISGAGSKTSRTCHGPDTLFAQETLGFMAIDFWDSGATTLTVFAFNSSKEQFENAYELSLFDFTPIQSTVSQTSEKARQTNEKAQTLEIDDAI